MSSTSSAVSALLSLPEATKCKLLIAILHSDFEGVAFVVHFPSYCRMCIALMFVEYADCMHCRGEPIHRVQYTADEIKTWGTVLRELTKLYPQHACQEFQRNFPMFNFRQHEVPQLEDMSSILKYEFASIYYLSVMQAYMHSLLLSDCFQKSCCTACVQREVMGKEAGYCCKTWTKQHSACLCVEVNCLRMPYSLDQHTCVFSYCMWPGLRMAQIVLLCKR